ncbi:hypothetical protein [Marinospirillum alkaliphilum]|uniref:MetA-pathway of phenol degradation n=1 Tax=Marinospirillum alkaliphilum DSM 21637 TaxID=1122209 RepID=A0A1K1VA15_9GAMM|nr:hypothetical protein [Marinospirillum alkaliphilum]SFX21903.1 hypothetical protein SAMN02745752_00856 [Marinospirillum alkaliphilum DSM 21637]
MKKLLSALCFAVAVLLPFHASAMTHTIGTDVVRLIDNNMDDGMFNLFWQGSLSRSSAVRASYSSGDNLNILEVTYKGYIDRYHQGVFYEVGGAWWDGRNDDDLGLMAAIGYERSLAKHVVAGGSVQMVAGIDDAIGMGESPFFLPSLYFAFAF